MGGNPIITGVRALPVEVSPTNLDLSPLHTHATARLSQKGRLRNLDPKPPVQSYEWERPGDLIHIDAKKPPPQNSLCNHHQGHAEIVGLLNRCQQITLKLGFGDVTRRSHDGVG